MLHRRGFAILTGAVLATVAMLIAGSPAFAQYHAPGSLVCSDCHTIHFSQDGGDPTGADAGGPHARLLKKTNVTDLCLTCHDTTLGAASPAPKVKGPTIDLPGGDFDYVFAANPGKGHSLNGTGFAAANVSPSPGGNYVSASLRCTSCHDAHGDTNVAYAYRLLLKTVNSVDVSAAISSDGGDEATLTTGGNGNNSVATDVLGNHNVYQGANFGAWCGACHSNPDNAGTGFHGQLETDLDVGDGVTTWERHPTGTVFPAAYATNYGATYNPVYPVVTTAAGAATNANWAIVASESYVFCLSCHVAHASNYANATRWDNAAAQGVGGGCGKCHAK